MPPTTMSYENALKEARKWAEGAQIGSLAARTSLTYIHTMLKPGGRNLSSCGQRTQLRCILENLQGWKGGTARAAKEAIKAQIRELGGSI